MQAFTKRRPVIEWAGAQHAYPVQKADAPSEVKLSRHGEDEAGWRRVGWAAFFRALDQGHALVVVESPDGFAHRILPREQARRELPPEAFGRPWWETLIHEIWLVRPDPPSGQGAAGA